MPEGRELTAKAWLAGVMTAREVTSSSNSTAVAALGTGRPNGRRLVCAMADNVIEDYKRVVLRNRPNGKNSQFSGEWIERHKREQCNALRSVCVPALLPSRTQFEKD